MATNVTVTKVYASPDYWQGGGSQTSYSFTYIGGGSIPTGATSMTWSGDQQTGNVAMYGGQTVLLVNEGLNWNSNASQLNLRYGARVNQSTLYTFIGADYPGYTTQTQYVRHDGYVAVPHYDTADSPFGIIGGSAQNTTNLLDVGGGNSSLYAATTIRFYTAADNTTATGTITATLTPSTLQLVNAAELDQYGQWLTVGADQSTWTARTDSTNKTGGIQIPHYLNAEEEIPIILGFSLFGAGGGENRVYIGGGNTLLNAATETRFYAASNYNTLQGTLITTIDVNGLVMNNNTTITSPTYYVDDGSSNPNSIYVSSDSAGNMVFADNVISAGEVTLSDLLTGSPGSPGSYNFTNGLTEESNGDVVWGGTLAQATTIVAGANDITYTAVDADTYSEWFFDSNRMRATTFSETSGDWSDTAAQMSVQSTAAASVVSLYIYDDTSGNDILLSIGTANGFVITDSLFSLGMVYDADYSTAGTADDRWIPDYGAVKAYADSAVSGGTYWDRSSAGVLSPITSGDSLLLDNAGYLDQYGEYILLGADTGSWTARTNSTQKGGSLVAPHYDNSEEVFNVITGFSGAANNNVYIGGANTSRNAATRTYIYAAANTTTLTGTWISYWDVNGLRMNSGYPITSDTYYVSDASAQSIYITTDSAGNMVFADSVISAGEVTLSDLLGGAAPGGGYWSRNAAGYVYPTTTSDYISMNPIDIRQGTTEILSYNSTYNNIRFGEAAGVSSQTGSYNAAIGFGAGDAMTDASYCVAIGYAAMSDNTTLDNIICIGGQAGANLDGTTQHGTVAIGGSALLYATTSQATVAIGHKAGQGQSGTPPTGGYNVFIGYETALDFQISAYSVCIGYRAATNLTTGFNNVAIGSNALAACTSSAGNVAIGNYALNAITTSANSNVAIGDNAGTSFSGTLSNSVFVGTGAGPGGSGGCSGLTCIGASAGGAGDDYNNGTFVGYLAGMYNEGNDNTYVGYGAGRGVPTSLGSVGVRNVGLGYEALNEIVDGDYNIAIGGQAGDVIQSGSYNILIGYQVDGDAESDNYLFRLGYATNYLLDGNMQSGSQELTINGVLYLPGLSNTDSAETLQYIPSSGEVCYYDDTSDIRLKDIVAPIENASVKIKEFDAFTYRFNELAAETMGHDTERVRLGISAQSVKTYFPEAVSRKSSGYLKLNYTDLIPVLVAGHNEHSDEIQHLKDEIHQLRKQVEKLLSKFK